MTSVVTARAFVLDVTDQKGREGWVSRKGGGEGEDSCSCAETSGSEADQFASRLGDIHWAGARSDQPRGNCLGDSHGPECGHDVSRFGSETGGSAVPCAVLSFVRIVVLSSIGRCWRIWSAVAAGSIHSVLREDWLSSRASESFA